MIVPLQLGPTESSLLEFRILADEEHHAELVGRATETFPEPLRENGRIVARWVRVAGESAELKESDAVVTKDDRPAALVLHYREPAYQRFMSPLAIKHY